VDQEDAEMNRMGERSKKGYQMKLGKRQHFYPLSQVDLNYSGH
jgi:hypothetical protein